MLPIHSPALRDRPEEIEAISLYFIDHYNQKYYKRTYLSENNMEFLLHYSWPGNVRELRNVIERAVLISPPDRRELPLNQMFSSDPFFSDVPEQTAHSSSGISMPSLDLPLQDALEQFEQQYIQAVIDKNRGQLSETARSLGIHRTTLYRKQQKNKIPTSL